MVITSAISRTLRRTSKRFCPQRLCALLTLIVFTTGLFGWPINLQFKPVRAAQRNAAQRNVDLSGGPQENASTTDVSAQQLDVGDSPMQSCCCPPTVQAEHRCCCSAGASVVVRSQSCCTDPKDSSTPAPDGQRKQPTRGAWQSCACGTLSGSLLLSCGEPRLLNSGIAVQVVPVWNEPVEFTSLPFPLRDLSPETPPPRPCGC